MANTPEINPPDEAYCKAIEDYKTCRRELAECEIAIEVAHMHKDTAANRVALSNRKRLLVAVDDAKERVQDAAVDVVRCHGMAPKDGGSKEGILHKAVDIIGKIVKG